MYCSVCGLQNPDSSPLCTMCGAGLPNTPSPADEKVHIDLTQIPTWVFVRHASRLDRSLKHFFLQVLLTIVLSLKKLTKSRMPVPFFLSLGPKVHLTSREEKPEFEKNKRLKDFEDFLTRAGFEKLTTYEDRSLSRGNLISWWVHRPQKVYAALVGFIGLPRYATLEFLGLYPGQFLCVDNGLELPISFPPNVQAFHFDHAKPDFLWEEYQKAARAIPKSSVLVNLGTLFRFRVKERHELLRRGRASGVFHLESSQAVKGGASLFVASCRNHPNIPAVRHCQGCGAPLCESCFDISSERTLCSSCDKTLPREETIRMPRPARMAEESPGPVYAGLGVRGGAALIDFLILGLVCLGLIMAGRELGDWLGGTPTFTSLGTTLGIGFGSAISAAYLIWPMVRTGQTPGMKLFRLHAVESSGRTPGFGAVLIRFFYLLYSFMFIIPFLGFLTIPFSRFRQGIHDRLAGILVMTRKSAAAAIMGWLLLAAALVGGLGGLTIMATQFYFRQFQNLDIRPEAEPHLTLAPVWTKTLDGDDEGLVDAVVKDRQILLASWNFLAAYDLQTGTEKWKNPKISFYEDETPFDQAPLPSMFVQYDSEGRGSVVKIDLTTGATLWSSESNLIYPGLVTDERVAVLYEKKDLRVFDAQTGRENWRKSLSGPPILYVILNQHQLLVVQSQDKNQNITLLDSRDGRIVWEYSSRDLRFGLALVPGFNLFSTQKNGLALMNLEDHSLVWTSEPETGFFLAKESEGEETALPGRIFASAAVLAGDTGKILFKYPKDYHYLGHQKAGLVLMKLPFDEEPLANILVIDPGSWTVQKEIRLDPTIRFNYLEEDESTWLFLGEEPPVEGSEGPVKSFLATLGKEDLAVTVVPLGTDVILYEARVFPDQNLVFLASPYDLGMYRLPAPGRDPVPGGGPDPGPEDAPGQDKAAAPRPPQ